MRTRPLMWLTVLGGALPPAAFLIGASGSILFTDEWAAPPGPDETPALQLCGLGCALPACVLAVGLEVSAVVERRKDALQMLTLGWALVAAGAAFTLVRAAGVNLGFRDPEGVGRVPFGLFVGFGAALLYSVAVAWGHWRLTRLAAGGP